MRKVIGIISIFLVFAACKDEAKPKPKGFLALEFPDAMYHRVDLGCAFTFEVNDISSIKSYGEDQCKFNIEYPKMGGTIYLTYEKIDGNLKELLEDAQKLPLKHTITADEIFGDEYSSESDKAYGMLYTVTGDAASQSQFFLTDSIDHFITGSVYFNRAPNYDSIYPAAEYLKTDMKKMMESIRWENEADNDFTVN